MRKAEDPAPTAVGIGHVHLRVADLDRTLTFYRDVLGLALNAYGPDLGVPGAAFLAAGGYHHHVGLNTFESEGARPRRPGTRASTTSPSSTPTGASSPSRSGASTITIIPSMGPTTTARRSPCTCATPTKTASSSTTTARGSGGSTGKAGRSSKTNPSTRASCWRR